MPLLDLRALADVAALPTVTSAPRPLAGVLREQPSDFRVDEIPAYSPEGSGDHLYVRFEKIDLDTTEAVRRIARALGVELRDTGYAGLKDRRAVTTQWASFLFGDPERLASAAIDNVRVMEWARHKNKLRTGHLRGNRFEILVRGASAESVDEASARLALLAKRGIPNYFGEQRFGRDGGNVLAAHRWLVLGERAPRDRWKRKLYVSSLQGALFNVLCAERVGENTYDRVIDGDLVRKEDTGGLFVSEQTDVDCERALRFEVSATGPMFGDSMRWPEREARAREEAVLRDAGLSIEQLSRVRASGPGARRTYRMRPTDVWVHPEENGVRVAFTLPSGAYATIVMRELLGEAAS
jgi:tRNA pseudouridine13 synthase